MKRDYRISLVGIILLALLLVACHFMTGCTFEISEYTTNIDDETKVNEDIQNKNIGDTSKQDIVEVDENKDYGNCDIIFIDCGQADSILFHGNEFSVLIDAGEKRDAKEIIEVLDEYNIEHIDLLVGTHPHADHIGGMKTIIENYSIGEILMSPTGHTSKLYENLLLAIQDKGMTIQTSNVGDVYKFGDLELEVICPKEKSKNLNDNSVVLLAKFGDTDVLLTGDAEVGEEVDYLPLVRDIEILKVGHHGSDTATTDELLNSCKPEEAVISVGTDNKYNHPYQSTLDKLSKRGINIYRTDLDGTILIKTDGKDYEILKEKGE